jgi:hypothetical protein
MYQTEKKKEETFFSSDLMIVAFCLLAKEMSLLI